MSNNLTHLDGTFTLLLGSMLCGFDLIAAVFAMLPDILVYPLLGLLAMLTMLVGGLQLLQQQQNQSLLELLADMTC